MTVNKAIKRAYRIAGIIDEEEPLSGEQLQNGIDALNTMLRSWFTTQHGIFALTRENFTLVSGTGTYSIGTGATFNTVRPIKISSAFLRDGTIDYPLDIVDLRWFNERFTDKTVQGRPEYLYYDQSYPNGSIELYDVPGQAYTLFINSIKPFTEVTSAGDSLLLPPEYEAAVPFNLAIELAAENSVDPRPVVAARAAETLRIAKRVHATPVSQVFTDVVGTNKRTFEIERGY